MKTVKGIVIFTAFTVGLIFSVIAIGSEPLRNNRMQRPRPRQLLVR